MIYNGEIHDQQAQFSYKVKIKSLGRLLVIDTVRSYKQTDNEKEKTKKYRSLKVSQHQQSDGKSNIIFLWKPEREDWK